MAFHTKLENQNKNKIQEPSKYKVVMYNDDFTPMDFVVDILMSIFHKQQEDAVEIMMEVHKGNKATVGVYTYDIACTKTEQAISRAREEGYPFCVKTERA